MGFKNKIKITLIDPDKDIWETLDDLVYETEDHKVFVVPAGFVCDLASIPRLPLTWWLFKTADTHAAGILHDWLCREKVIPRKEADAIFYEALRSMGVNVVKAKLMHWAVALVTLTQLQ